MAYCSSTFQNQLIEKPFFYLNAHNFVKSSAGFSTKQSQGSWIAIPSWAGS